MHIIHLQTVRDDNPKNTDFLRNLAQALPGKLEIAKADNLKEGSYNKVVQGAKYVYALENQSLPSLM